MNRRQPILKVDFDLETLGDACAKTSWQVHAYCLDWIAQQLNMGAAGYATQCLHQAESGRHANLRD